MDIFHTLRTQFAYTDERGWAMPGFQGSGLAGSAARNDGIIFEMKVCLLSR